MSEKTCRIVFESQVVDIVLPCYTCLADWSALLQVLLAPHADHIPQQRRLGRINSAACHMQLPGITVDDAPMVLPEGLYRLNAEMRVAVSASVYVHVCMCVCV